MMIWNPGCFERLREPSLWSVTDCQIPPKDAVPDNRGRWRQGPEKAGLALPQNSALPLPSSNSSIAGTSILLPSQFVTSTLCGILVLSAPSVFLSLGLSMALSAPALACQSPVTQHLLGAPGSQALLLASPQLPKCRAGASTSLLALESNARSSAFTGGPQMPSADFSHSGYSPGRDCRASRPTRQPDWGQPTSQTAAELGVQRKRFVPVTMKAAEGGDLLQATDSKLFQCNWHLPGASVLPLDLKTLGKSRRCLWVPSARAPRDLSGVSSFCSFLRPGGTGAGRTASTIWKAQRQVQNAHTGLDLSVPTYQEVRGKMMSGHVEYQVVVVTRLPAFKSPKHRPDDVVQFMVSKKYSEIEEFYQKLMSRYPQAALPLLPRKILFVGESDIRERRAVFNDIMRQIAKDGELVSSPELLEFLGTKPSGASDLIGRRLQEQEKEETDGDPGDGLDFFQEPDKTGSGAPLPDGLSHQGAEEEEEEEEEEVLDPLGIMRTILAFCQIIGTLIPPPFSTVLQIFLAGAEQSHRLVLSGPLDPLGPVPGIHPGQPGAPLLFPCFSWGSPSHPCFGPFVAKNLQADSH
ncbi:HCLS1-binding protein 3 [Sarcophilus harrisii]|uniref:HCLS1-binding protein 3 n=1 Tax=Sarcophilus harrisii TaxID=9305 RepID=UPI001301FC62|nr:HCLS1-binding protein 3 [Sarcophilus harrisii]